MAKRKIIRRSNRPFTYNPHYYNWGGDFKNALGTKPFDLKNTFSGANVANMLKGGLASGLGNAIGSGVGNLIGGGLESGVGSAISNIGGTIGSAVSAVNPVLGGIVTAGTGILGGVTNALFGSKLNQENINNIEGSNRGMNTLMVDNSSTDSIENQWANQDFGADFSKSDIGKDGLLGNKAKKKYRQLKLQQDIARNRALTSFEDAASAADTQSDLNAMASFDAFGGPLNKFSDGGNIHIKPSKRGTFTAAAKKHGKSVQEFASQVLANKENYSPTMVKKANFARNASRWHAFGGDLNTNGADFTNGQIIVGNGGTHEENPMEGVPMGMDAEGNPNLVEQGEVIFNDYVFSNRLFADKKLLENFGLPTSYDNHSFAAIAEKLGEESKERPNDPISKRGLMSSMSKLQQAQENMRQEKQANQNKNKYAHGGTMGMLFDGKGPFYNGFIPSYEDWVSSELVPDTPVFGVDWHPTGKISYTKGETSPNYQVREASVPTTFWEALDKKSEEQNKYVHRVPVKNSNTSTNTDNASDLSWLRYAPVVGSAIGLGQNLFSKPDYTSADTILEAANQAGNYNPIGYTPIGNYLQYRPFDRNFYLNKLNAQAGATRRAIMNTTSPSRNAALLAADYNAQGRLGDLARQAEEYNLAQRQAVETFNRGTNQANAEMGLKAAMANQEAALKARSSRLSGVAQAMSVRDAVDARRGASMSANLSNFFNSLGDIGKEEYSRNMIMSNPALYYSIDNKGNVTYKNGYESLSEAEKKGVRDAANKAKKKKAKGGYLTIKKK